MLRHVLSAVVVVSAAMNFAPPRSLLADEPPLTVKAQRGAQEVSVELEQGVAVIVVASSTGIGRIVVQSADRPWPMSAKLRLRYNDKRGFQSLEGLTITDSKSRMQTFLGAKTVEVAIIDESKPAPSAKPELNVQRGEKFVEVELPMAWLAGEKEFTIDWIDFYRG